MSAAEHLPTGHRLRSVEVSDLRHVHLQGHGMGQPIHDTTQHARVFGTQIRCRGIAATRSVHEIYVFPDAIESRKHRYVSPACLVHCLSVFATFILLFRGDFSDAYYPQLHFEGQLPTDGYQNTLSLVRSYSCCRHEPPTYNLI